ncbi:MAG: type II toxin-antitoxin system VapC family toxin [Micrococcales bacterium]|nr:type II toxin-antitoxin system VapC family toxin [Micrococcales bacterium]
MIVDSSAIVAILKGEPDSEALLSALGQAPVLKMSTATYVELHAVVGTRGDPSQSRRVDAMLKRLGIRLVPFDNEQAIIAKDAYRDFGKGSGHPARLNLGDSFSYALAAQTAEPLLFVGDDFTHTDLRPAL